MSKMCVHSALIACLVSVLAVTSYGQAAADTPPSSDQLTKVLQSDAAQKEKADACRLLQRVGTKDAVPVLAKLLVDEKLAHMARYALEPIPEALVEEVLRAALPALKGRLLAGVIGSLGVRHDTQAVDALTKLLENPDPMVAEAAARALGSIGTLEAGKAVQAALPKAPAPSRLAFCEGLLRCAEKLSASGARQEAAGIYDLLRGTTAGIPSTEMPHQVKTAGVRGAILARGDTGLPLLVEYLHNKDYLLFAAACRTSQEMTGEEVTRALTAALGEAPAENQILLLQTLALRGDSSAVPSIAVVAKGGAKAVRLAALHALGEIRHESSAAALKDVTTDSDAEISQAAKDGLASFQPAHPAGT